MLVNSLTNWLVGVSRNDAKLVVASYLRPCHRIVVIAGVDMALTISPRQPKSRLTKLSQ